VTRWLSNLRLRVLGLVLVAMIPAVGLLLITAHDQREDAIDSATENARRFVNLATADQSRQIESTRQLLTVLARLPETQAGGEACGSLLADLRKQFPGYANIGVVGADGMLDCSSVLANGPVYLGDRPWFRESIDRNAFVVGEYYVDPVTKKSALTCGLPVIAPDGSISGVVFAAFDLASLAQFASQADLPDGARLTVLDRSGRVLVRLPDEPGLIGASLAATTTVSTILATGSGITEETADGERYLVAYETLRTAEQGAAYISIALPRGGITEAADNQFANNLTRLGLAVLVILIAAWVGTDLLVRQRSEENKVLVRRLYDAYSTGGVDLLDEVVGEDFLDHDPIPDQPPGLASLKHAVNAFRAAFPDGEMVVDGLVAEGDQVVARVAMTGTFAGDYGGIPATGEPVRAEGVETFRVARGKVVEGWSRFVLPIELLGRPGSPAIGTVSAWDASQSNGYGERRQGRVMTVFRSIGRKIRPGGSKR
jgi:predicted ester cyclase